MSSNGCILSEWALTGHDPPWRTTFQFPRQEKPSPQEVWATWRKLLRTRYCQTHPTRLAQPLGRWFCRQLTQVWDTVINPAMFLIYIWIDQRVCLYERQGRSQKQY
jgi:hypothetical protein